jgi:hypothetical protein
METLLKINEQWMHAPAGIVVAAFAIAFGYVLKASSFFPNNRIPLVIVLVTASAFTLLQLCADLAAIAASTHPWLRIPQNALLGFVIGFAAWTFHAQILKRWVDPKLFPDDQTKP